MYRCSVHQHYFITYPCFFRSWTLSTSSVIVNTYNAKRVQDLNWGQNCSCMAGLGFKPSTIQLMVQSSIHWAITNSSKNGSRMLHLGNKPRSFLLWSNPVSHIFFQNVFFLFLLISQCGVCMLFPCLDCRRKLEYPEEIRTKTCSQVN